MWDRKYICVFAEEGERKTHHLGEFVNIPAVKRDAGYRYFNPTLSPAVTRVRMPTRRSVSVGVIGLLSKHEGQVGLQLSVSDKVEEK